MDESDEHGRPHVWRIDEREYARQLARRGRRHAYERIDAEKTALVVVDMIPFFVDENPYCRAIVPNIDKLAGTLRNAGGHVAWVLPAQCAEPGVWATEFFGPKVADAFNSSGGTGELRDRLWPGFVIHDSDLLVEKSAASAFCPGRCALPAQLEARGVDTVLICGTVTNVCCESSARDAATLGFRVVMVADANATVFDDWHNATLRSIYRSFGDVRPTEELIEMMADAP